ncbi:hypothetical protein [Telmatospirillum sp.]|uniref:hypothetical protein n=1 Tax=Telmatospirillum sp. TaxID=2079197 RepID=UPI0028421C90|nr:hypothetical protein [Telmatospirillum sp.]MDR3437983.1 hypothetical protein [Telmatospirillum sp.]
MPDKSTAGTGRSPAPAVFPPKATPAQSAEDIDRTAVQIIVHTPGQVRGALLAAAQAGQPVALNSAPGAVSYLGTGYFLAMIAAARQQIPQASSLALLDCGRTPGFALAALADGATAVRLDAPPAVFEKVAQIARKRGGWLFGPTSADRLDLNGVADPQAAVLALFSARKPL